jgi:ABC-type transporter Mla MlaB component
VSDVQRLESTGVPVLCEVRYTAHRR